jgi:hypothetical protein
MTDTPKDGENSSVTETTAAEVKAEDHEAAAKSEREQAEAAKPQKSSSKRSNRAGGDTGSGVDLHNDNDEWPAGRARPPEVDASFPNIEFEEPVTDEQRAGNPATDQSPVRKRKG